MKHREILKNTKPEAVLGIAIVIYVVFFTILVLWKYNHFYYDNLDLAIFNNTFWNTLHGSWFSASIHPPSYLGDHFSPGIFLLLPFYALVPRPQTLLILQTIAIAVSALPLYLIAKKFLGEGRRWSAFFVSSLWLISPLVHNMNFFEFELMAFAILGLLWSVWAFLEQRPWLFFAATLFALSMREDFIFILFVFGIVALIEKRSLYWKAYPMLMSLLWAFVAFSVIGMFAPHGSYKFLRYYSWLGGTDLFSIAMSFITHPWEVLLHLTTWYNIEFVLGLLFPFFFLISFRNRYALLLLPPTAQVMLAAFGGSALILNVYYAAYTIALLFVLFAYHLKDLDVSKLPGWIPIELRSRKVVYGLVLFASLYAAGTYGSITPALAAWTKPNTVEAKQRFLSLVPAGVPVATTYELLAPLSSRQNVYLFAYAAIGKNQFAASDYPLPENTEYLLIDWDSMVISQVQFSLKTPFYDFRDNVPDNLRTIFSKFSIVQAEDSLMLLKRNEHSDTAEQLASISPLTAPFVTEAKIHSVKSAGSALGVTVELPQASATSTPNYYLSLKTGRDATRIPLGYWLLNPTELATPSRITVPIFIGTTGSDLTIDLYRWKKARLELTGIKNLSTPSDAELIDSYDFTR